MDSRRSSSPATVRSRRSFITTYGSIGAFWSPGSAGYPHLWDFLKNFGLVGGLLLIVLGSDLVAQVEHAAKEISASEIVHVQAD
jgi:hypothetical protein